MQYIFENEAIDMDTVDFTKWLTQDGEQVDLTELTDEQIQNAILTLRRKLKMLPEHVNEDIWEEYLYLLREESMNREEAKEKH